MTFQIFRQPFPENMFFQLMDQVCDEKTSEYYYFNKNAFKKGMLMGLISVFLKDCEAFYYTSKHKYLKRHITYKNFMTVLRQICNHLKFPYKTTVLYSKSEFEICYYVYYRRG